MFMAGGFTSNALITNLTAASTIAVYQDVVNEYKYAALFGRINYQYKNRYFLTLQGGEMAPVVLVRTKNLQILVP